MGVGVLFLLLMTVTPSEGPESGNGLVGLFGCDSLTPPDRVTMVGTWISLRRGLGPALMECPAVDLVNLLMTELVDTGVNTGAPAHRTSLGLDLCEAALPRLAPPVLVPDPSGRLWTDPRTVPTRLREAAETARKDVRGWCREIAAKAAEEAPCRSLRIRLLARPADRWTPKAGAAARPAARRACGNKETSHLSFVIHALTGDVKEFARIRSLMREDALAEDPLLSAAVRLVDRRAWEGACRDRWRKKGDLDAALDLLRDAARRGDRVGIRALAAEVAAVGREGRTLAAVALARVGLTEEATAALDPDSDREAAAHLAVFAALQTALSKPNPAGDSLDQALATLASLAPVPARQVRFVYDAVVGLPGAYGDATALTEEVKRLEVAARDLLDRSDQVALDLGLGAAQLYALEAWPALDRFLDHALRGHPAAAHPDVALAAARVLLLVGARHGDIDRLQQALVLLEQRIDRAGEGGGDPRARATAIYLALAAELVLAARGAGTEAAMTDLGLRLAAVDEEVGDALAPGDLASLRANLFGVCGRDTPSRRRHALEGLWRDHAGAPLTLLLTAMDRWYDGRYLEAALMLRLLSRTGCGGPLTALTTTWWNALRAASGATPATASMVRGGVVSAWRVLVDGDLRIRIVMGWDGRIRVEIHPEDSVLVLPSPPGAP